MDIPHILLIGDSIRMRYAPLVQQNLRGKAKVYSPRENGEDSRKVLKRLKRWVKRSRVGAGDLIHINCGLHDLKRQFGSTKRQVPIQNYKKNLEQIISTMERISPAAIIWALTTPVIDARHHEVKGFDRFNEDVLDYNEIVRNIVTKHSIPVNDLYQIIIEGGVESCLGPDGVHMTEKGNKLLAETVTRAIKEHFKFD